MYAYTDIQARVRLPSLRASIETNMPQLSLTSFDQIPGTTPTLLRPVMQPSEDENVALVTGVGDLTEL